MPPKNGKSRYLRTVDRGWSAHQTAILIELYKTMSAKNVQREMNRRFRRNFSLSGIYSKVRELKLPLKLQRGTGISPAENAETTAEEMLWEESRARRKIASPNMAPGITVAQLISRK